MMNKTIALGLKLAVFNLFVVSILGGLMRYKIAFPLEFLVQKHMQEAHSHFAFYGWTTTAIYFLILRDLSHKFPDLRKRKYYLLIATNLLCSYAMLGSFISVGYNWVSILFSIAALLVNLAFLIVLSGDLRSKPTLWGRWYLGGLAFAVLSSVGVLYIANAMITHHMTQGMYLGATYYFLHFQYNGFFIFACFGLLLSALERLEVEIPKNLNIKIFWTMFVGTLLAFGLSVLWAKLPLWIFALIILGSLLQTYGSVLFIGLVKRNWAKLKANWSPLQRFILLYVGFAYVVKILLQLGSNIPAVSKFAFGFRNIVIAYLHLVLLMCVGTFLLSLILHSGVFKRSKAVIIGLYLFLLGTFLNEFFLGINGILSIKYIMVPYTQYTMFGITLLIMIALGIIFFSIKIKRKSPT